MSRRTPALLTCGSNPLAAALLLLLASAAGGQSCAPTDEIVSNNMRYCAGSGDTLWVASYRQGWGVNYTLDRGVSWGGYNLGCYPDHAMAGLVFGGGRAAAILNPPDDYLGRHGSTAVWRFSHAGSQTASFVIDWPDTVENDTTGLTAQARGAVYVAGSFYFACGHGGIVRWDPAADSLKGFLFGDTLSFVPSAFNRSQHPVFGTDTTAVLSVDRCGDSAVLVTTAPRLLLFNTGQRTWDTGITAMFSDTAVHFESFSAAFVNNTVRPPLLYAYVKYRKAAVADSSLFRFCTAQRRWYYSFSGWPGAAAAAPRGYLYMLTGDNSVAVYRDTVPDTGTVAPGVLKLVQDQIAFDARLLRGVPKPKFINDLVFLPSGDSTGSLCIVSSDGLFVSWDETAGDSAVGGTFTVIKRARVIKDGLAEAYALPGIITYASDWSQALFIYKLARDATVTIRIYDYNMQYIKSVIENAPRRAAAPFGRSTDSRYDAWDGTGASGRPVAPGVYYFRITASTGERCFGRIVVAKGR